jgi:hypothetical protein
MRENRAQLCIPRGSHTRLHLDQIRPHGLVFSNQIIGTVYRLPSEIAPELTGYGLPLRQA